MKSQEQFMAAVAQAVELFPTNQICRKVDSGRLTIEDYHKILLMIFHQTFEGPSTFALAGAHCPPRYHQARDYLLHHADEEKSHWEWVIGDLKNTGFKGQDPREIFPKPACQAYVAFNVYTALRFPLARLGIAVVLESIGANFGKKYAEKIIKNLKLKPNQVVFFLGHGDTDVGHTQDLLKIIETCALTEKDWEWMTHAAKVSGELYRRMYDEAVEL